MSGIAVSSNCPAHQEALAVKHAADDVPQIKKFINTLDNMYKFYEYSAVRTAGLKLVQVCRLTSKYFNILFVGNYGAAPP